MVMDLLFFSRRRVIRVFHLQQAGIHVIIVKIELSIQERFGHELILVLILDHFIVRGFLIFRVFLHLDRYLSVRDLSYFQFTCPKRA